MLRSVKVFKLTENFSWQLTPSKWKGVTNISALRPSIGNDVIFTINWRFHVLLSQPNQVRLRIVSGFYSREKCSYEEAIGGRGGVVFELCKALTRTTLRSFYREKAAMSQRGEMDYLRVKGGGMGLIDSGIEGRSTCRNLR